MLTRHNTACLRAFTLIELLVVISIIALLIAILLPALSAARESAKRVQCASQERQIQLALSSYTYDNGGNAPPAGWEVSSSPLVRQYWPGLITAYGKYLSSPEIFWCPIRTPGPYGGTIEGMMADRYSFTWAYTGYGINRFGVMPYATDTGYRPVNIDAIPASEVIVMAEVRVPSYFALTPPRDGWYQIVPQTSVHRLITHQGAANISFFDGHVESPQGEEIGWSNANDAWDAGYDTTQSPWYYKIYTTSTP